VRIHDLKHTFGATGASRRTTRRLSPRTWSKRRIACVKTVPAKCPLSWCWSKSACCDRSKHLMLQLKF